MRDLGMVESEDGIVVEEKEVWAKRMAVRGDMGSRFLCFWGRKWVWKSVMRYLRGLVWWVCICDLP
ncbi:hypothetical protein BDR22DRAFT_829495 [Usnea florida]